MCLPLLEHALLHQLQHDRPRLCLKAAQHELGPAHMTQADQEEQRSLHQRQSTVLQHCRKSWTAKKGEDVYATGCDTQEGINEPAASSNFSEELGRLQKKLDSWQKFAVSGTMPS